MCHSVSGCGDVVGWHGSRRLHLFTMPTTSTHGWARGEGLALHLEWVDGSELVALVVVGRDGFSEWLSRWAPRFGRQVIT